MMAEDELNISVLEGSESATTAAEVLQNLKEVWMNERLSPELLPHRFELVECMLDQITQVEANIENAKAKEPYRCHVHKMELDRIRYILSNYLRCRLEKIENYCLYLQNLPERTQEVLLSPSESQLLERFVTITKELIEASVNPYLEPGIKILDQWQKKYSRPKIDSFVMVRPKVNVNRILLDTAISSGIPQYDDLAAGQCYLMRYSAVKELVKQGYPKEESTDPEPIKVILI